MAATPYGIYVHVPFCHSLCSYCDFVRYLYKADDLEAYLRALCREIDTYDGDVSIKTIFLGGGTPSLLSETQLEKIFSALHRKFKFAPNLSRPEISMEVNSEDVTDSRVKIWKSLGVNRISVGVQSFDDATLIRMGRRHDGAKARKAIETVGRHFDNWGMDLIFGASSRNTWMESLRIARAYNPPHISTYELSYCPGTPLYAERDTKLDEDLLLGLYQDARLVLEDYEHYEISNFAQRGFQCQHNITYWTNEWYLGFGPGAYSFADHCRMVNTSDLPAYVQDPLLKAERLQLSTEEEQVETLIQHFRLRDGLDPNYFHRRFGVDVHRSFGTQLKRLIERGLLEYKGDKICPTEQGFFLNDEIGLELLP
ncbi:MAG: radical SAM family heme chaperone HemW [Candidatus Hydrogenedentes bacterium]|nr:radical SAM family heme chaperone HemW [Candidatus Hydrogenedentota bacterium]